MDIRMPDLDGIEATRRLLADPDPPRVLMLTTFDLDEYVYEALRAGASGFLLKDAPRERARRRGPRSSPPARRCSRPTITRRLIEQFVRRPPPGAPARRSSRELTARELEVLTWSPRGLSNGEIAERLFLSEATVKTHVAHLLRKLELRDRVQAVVLAYESGLVQPG